MIETDLLGSHLFYDADNEKVSEDLLQEGINIELQLSKTDVDYHNKLPELCTDEWYSSTEDYNKLSDSTFEKYNENALTVFNESLMNSFSNIFEPEEVKVMEDDIICTDIEINSILDDCTKSLVNEVNVDGLIDENANIDFLLRTEEQEVNNIANFKCNVSLSKDPSVTDTAASNKSTKFVKPNQTCHRDSVKQDVVIPNDVNGHRDFSQYTDDEVKSIIGANVSGTSRGRPEEPFPLKLHRIIERGEQEGYSSIIYWLPHGRAFRIHDQAKFVQIILPKYFFQSRFTSFQRQLNIYGFRKLCRGVDQGAYCNEFFLRGRPGLCIGIRRLKKKPNFDSDFEPNFYKMQPLPEVSNVSSKASRKIYYVAVTKEDTREDKINESKKCYQKSEEESSNDELIEFLSHEAMTQLHESKTDESHVNEDTNFSTVDVAKNSVIMTNFVSGIKSEEKPFKSSRDVSFFKQDSIASAEGLPLLSLQENSLLSTSCGNEKNVISTKASHFYLKERNNDLQQLQVTKQNYPLQYQSSFKSCQSYLINRLRFI